MIYAALGALAALVASASAASLSDDATAWLANERFQQWKEKHGKTYSADEEPKRFQAFLGSLERVAERQKRGGETQWGLTKFSDMTAEEFRAQMLTYRSAGPRAEVAAALPLTAAALAATPSSVDWRDSGAVTAVKNQGGCGSCWAFSTTEAIESAWFLAGNKLVDFAPQQIVSCDTKDAGCRGGDVPPAINYVKSAGGLSLESDYPYTSGTFPWRSGDCKSSVKVSGGSVSGYTYAIPACSARSCSPDMNALAAAVAAGGPPAICVDAEPWQDYTGGIMTNAASGCKTAYSDLDHCVQLVGYQLGSYWLVRNSWDTDWGEDGYIRLEFSQNTCGVGDEVVLPTIA